MSNDRSPLQMVRDEELLHISRHQRIIHLLVMRRLPVIPQIEDEDLEFFRQLRRDPKPEVIRRAKQAVQENERFL